MLVNAIPIAEYRRETRSRKTVNMKFILILAFATVVVATVVVATIVVATPSVSEVEETYLANALAEIFNISQSDGRDCVRTTGANRENMMYLSRTIDMENSEITDKESLRNASCAFVCGGQKGGFIVDGNVDYEKFLNDLLDEAPKEVLAIAKESAKVCKEQETAQNDLCLYGYFFAKCAVVRTRKLIIEANAF